MKNQIFRSIAVIALFASPVVADHIPGHNDSDPVWPVPIPGQEFFDGGAMFVSALGPYDDWEITSTDFDITYISDGATPASTLAIDVSVLTQQGFKEFHLTGADLGFGSGPGTFTGTISTNELNGNVVESFLLPPFSQVNIYVGAIVGGIDGVAYFENSFINFNVTPTVPAPGALALMGFAAMAGRRRRRD